MEEFSVEKTLEKNLVRIVANMIQQSPDKLTEHMERLHDSINIKKSYNEINKGWFFDLQICTHWYRNHSNKNLKRHIEKAHKKEKLQNTFVVPNVIIFCTDFIWSFCLDFSTPKISQEDILNRLWVGNIKSWDKLFRKIR